MAAVTLGPVAESPQRIIGASGPALRAERRLRYAAAVPLVRASALWCDLGCGTGVDAAAALGGRPAPRTVLVDASAGALEEARSQFPGDEVVTLQTDLGTDDGVATVAAALTERAGEGGVTVTCFDCVEELTSFAPLVSRLVELADRNGFTVVLSVPNDAFWSIERPSAHTSWGERAFEELRTLLPAEHLVLRQVTVQGSAIVRGDGEPGIHPTEVEVDPGGVPSHLLVAFGPERNQVGGGAALAQVDMEEQRRWERQRDADLALLDASRGRAVEEANGDRAPEPSEQTA
jgi:hypothetical protein